jgi:hypothetical protein
MTRDQRRTECDRLREQHPNTSRYISVSSDGQQHRYVVTFRDKTTQQIVAEYDLTDAKSAIEAGSC